MQFKYNYHKMEQKSISELQCKLFDWNAWSSEFLGNGAVNWFLSHKSHVSWVLRSVAAFCDSWVYCSLVLYADTTSLGRWSGVCWPPKWLQSNVGRFLWSEFLSHRHHGWAGRPGQNGCHYTVSWQKTASDTKTSGHWLPFSHHFLLQETTSPWYPEQGHNVKQPKSHHSWPLPLH